MNIDDELNHQLENVVMKDDRRFFEKYKDRSYRLRPAFEVEIEEFMRRVNFDPTMITNSEGNDVPIPNDWCWWMAIWQIKPGIRKRNCFAAPVDLDPNPSEEIAANIWRVVTGKGQQ